MDAYRSGHESTISRADPCNGSAESNGLTGHGGFSTLATNCSVYDDSASKEETTEASIKGKDAAFSYALARGSWPPWWRLNVVKPIGQRVCLSVLMRTWAPCFISGNFLIVVCKNVYNRLLEC